MGSERGRRTLLQPQLVSTVAVVSTTDVVPAEEFGPKLLVVGAVAVEVATLTLISEGRSKLMPIDLHMFWVKPRVTVCGMLRWAFGFLERGESVGKRVGAWDKERGTYVAGRKRCKYGRFGTGESP